MITETLRVSAEAPQADVMARAGELIRAGRLVAFPTETVYGLGANALDAQAVARIFEAKGRPANNPLIVHVTSINAARSLVTDWPTAAAELAQRFWPGPLTLVLPKRSNIPDIVTAGLGTVGLRVPANPIAGALIEAAGVPIAAPSANRSTRLSPTRAEHVQRDLDGGIDMILDGGPTAGGLESTVLDLTTTPPRLLRPGLVPPHALEAVVGPINRSAHSEEGAAMPAPGMLARHYAPRTPLECVECEAAGRVESLSRQGMRLGWLAFGNELSLIPPGVTVLVMPSEPVQYAARLYAALHELDAVGVDRIVVSLPPDTETWLAIRDRLRRAMHV